jgi:outer membrane immunogenic protein
MNMLSKAAIAAVTTLAITGAAHAADLVVTPPVAESVAATDWSGFYAGFGVGHGSGLVTSSWATPFLPPYEDELDGWVAGLQAGYNVQTGPLVLGIEGNLDWTNLSTAGPPDHLPRDINWMGGLRARLGVAIDSVLLYGTAGVVVADTTGGSFLEEFNELHSGWTAGVGVEAMVSDSLSLKLEYAYSKFETKLYSFTDPAPFTLDVGFDTSVIKAGANFHF